MLVATACAATAQVPSLIPQPQKLEVRSGVFKLTARTRILAGAASRETGEYLAARLRPASGYGLKVETGERVSKEDILLTTREAKSTLGPEGYELAVTEDGIVLRAPSAAGLFYGVQSLLELLPPEIFSANARPDRDWVLPAVQIEDQPRFQWRGLMLDVSRHFFTPAEVKQLLDTMALNKLNRFHWHLVDDQGWRIEIKKYPRLTQVGAWRNGVGFDLDPKSTTAYGPDGRYGGFYSQADIREIVAYAAQRHITVIPEIEMPGHSAPRSAPTPSSVAPAALTPRTLRVGSLPGSTAQGKRRPMRSSRTF